MPSLSPPDKAWLDNGVAIFLIVFACFVVLPAAFFGVRAGWKWFKEWSWAALDRHFSSINGLISEASRSNVAMLEAFERRADEQTRQLENIHGRISEGNERLLGIPCQFSKSRGSP